MKFFLAITSVFFIVYLFTGCGFYYKVQSNDHQFKKEDLVKFIQEDKYIILHESDTAWCLSNIMYNDTTFSGMLSPLPNVHMKYKTENGNYRYKVNVPDSLCEKEIVNEVHLYIICDVKVNNIFFAEKYSSVSQVKVYSKNKGKTARSWILPAIIVPVVLVPMLASLLVFHDNSNFGRGYGH